MLNFTGLEILIINSILRHTKLKKTSISVPAKCKSTLLPSPNLALDLDYITTHSLKYSKSFQLISFANSDKNKCETSLNNSSSSYTIFFLKKNYKQTY